MGARGRSLRDRKPHRLGDRGSEPKGFAAFFDRRAGSSGVRAGVLPAPVRTRRVESPADRTTIRAMPNPESADGALKIAVFIDLENLAVGVGDARNAKFDIRLVLNR